MTPEQINIAIAEYCGWHKISKYANTPWGWKKGEEWEKCNPSPVPNYHGDLNAMHKAEKHLGDGVDNWLTYGRCLAETSQGFTWHGTAAKRAEAFLRAVGKWKEGA